MSKRRIRKAASQISDRNSKIIWIRRLLVIMVTFLLIIYFILRIVYDTGRFTIVLDRAGDPMSGLIIYNSLSDKKAQQKLQAEPIDFFTNIAESWLPENIGDEAEGSHNGTNYIAYTFYVENQGSATINYWYTIFIDDVIRDVDKAVRVMLYQNGERKIYAKAASNGGAEKDTIPFYSEEYVTVDVRKDFHEGEIDKYTIVIYLEGDDPDCVDALIGGQMKMHMEITEEQLGTQE